MTQYLQNDHIIVHINHIGTGLLFYRDLGRKIGPIPETLARGYVLDRIRI